MWSRIGFDLGDPHRDAVADETPAQRMRRFEDLIRQNPDHEESRLLRAELALAAEDFPAAMSAIAALRAPIDGFFEAVQVNADNAVLRRNRLNLLHRIRETGRRIADFGRIEG